MQDSGRTDERNGMPVQGWRKKIKIKHKVRVLCVSLIVICFPVLFNHRLAYRALTTRSYIPSAKGPVVFQGMTYKK